MSSYRSVFGHSLMTVFGVIAASLIMHDSALAADDVNVVNNPNVKISNTPNVNVVNQLITANPKTTDSQGNVTEFTVTGGALSKYYEVKRADDTALIFQEPPSGNLYLNNMRALNDVTSAVNINSKVVDRQRNSISDAIFGRSTLIEDHFKSHCASNVESAAGCPVASNEQKNSDLNIGTILNINTLNDANTAVANIVIRNMLYPIQDPLLKGLRIDNSGGELVIQVNSADERDKFIKAYARSAMLSPALLSLNTMLANRLPGQAAAAGGASNQSVISIIENEATRRIIGPNSQAWNTAVAGSSGEALLREITQMLAFQQYMMFQQYKQNERIEAILASSLAIQLDTNKLSENLTIFAKAGSTPVSNTE